MLNAEHIPQPFLLRAEFPFSISTQLEDVNIESESYK